MKYIMNKHLLAITIGKGGQAVSAGSAVGIPAALYLKSAYGKGL